MIGFLKKCIIIGLGLVSSLWTNLSFTWEKVCALFAYEINYRKNRKGFVADSINQEDAKKCIAELHPDSGALCLKFKDYEELRPNIITIIIPCYNVEKYIAECLDSILSQKVSVPIEIHVVDDGSTDSTPEILKKYAKTYPNLKVTFQQNSSQAVARNNALDECNSEWVMMVDGDDILVSGSLQHMLDLAINYGCDVVEGRVQMYYDKLEIEKKKLNLKISEGGLRQDYILTSKGYSCGKLYKRYLWNGVRYPEQYIFEDIVTKFVVCRKAKRYARTSNIVYGYRRRHGSSSHSGGMRKLDCLWVIKHVQNVREYNGIQNDIINKILLMNHFGALVPLMVRELGVKYQKAALEISWKYLQGFNVKPEGMPYYFRKSWQAISEGNLKNWFLTQEVMGKYKLLKNSREIN